MNPTLQTFIADTADITAPSREISSTPGNFKLLAAALGVDGGVMFCDYPGGELHRIASSINRQSFRRA